MMQAGGSVRGSGRCGSMIQAPRPDHPADTAPSGAWARLLVGDRPAAVMQLEQSATGVIGAALLTHCIPCGLVQRCWCLAAAPPSALQRRSL
jgi:hypothetical protein